MLALPGASQLLAQGKAEQPYVGKAEEAILLDARTGRVLFEKNADQPVPPASMSKLMTMILVFEALKAGKDIYCEKPLTLTINEGKQIISVLKQTDRVFQVGTQQRSMPINNWASDLVKNGAIGKVNVVQAPNFVGPVRWTSQPAEPLPSGGSDGW